MQGELFHLTAAPLELLPEPDVCISCSRSFSEIPRIERRMTTPCRFALNVEPRRSQPGLHFLFRQHRERLLHRSRRPVLAPFSQQKNVLDVVLDDCAWLVRLPVKAGPIAFCLGHSVSDFEPENRGECIKPNRARSHHDVSMQGHNAVTALPSRYANVTDDAANAAARRENAHTFPPNLIKLI